MLNSVPKQLSPRRIIMEYPAAKNILRSIINRVNVNRRIHLEIPLLNQTLLQRAALACAKFLSVAFGFAECFALLVGCLIEKFNRRNISTQCLSPLQTVGNREMITAFNLRIMKQSLNLFNEALLFF
jgi:hypothetical protein